jgi:FixJ family two-component response regulator
MIVDDDAAVARLIQMVLEMSGYETLIYERPEACLTAFAEGVEQVDLLITDQTMPVMTGLKLAEVLRDRGYRMPVILSSGFGDVATPEQLTQLEPMFLLSKPFDADALLRGVDKALRA